MNKDLIPVRVLAGDNLFVIYISHCGQVGHATSIFMSLYEKAIQQDACFPGLPIKARAVQAVLIEPAP